MDTKIQEAFVVEKEKAERARDRIIREYYDLIDKFKLCDECVCGEDKCTSASCIDLIKAWAEGE